MKKKTEDVSTTEQKSSDQTTKIFERVKRNNIMDWGEIEAAESVLNKK
jgi:hypothetical protein